MTEDNLLEQTKEDRRKFRKLRVLAMKLLKDKVRPEERSTLIRAAADDEGFRVTPPDICAITAHARREMQGRVGAVTENDEFFIPEEVWAWDQVIAAQTPNLVVALQKVGKTALVAALISAWHYGNGTFLGLNLHGPCPPVIIAGTDQTMADWRSVLAPAGLMQKQENGKWKLTPGGPIKRLWHRSQPVYLDMEGIEGIAKECEEYPGALLICDTYAALTAPLGLDESKPEAAEPLYNLMEMIEPHQTTPVLLHHASKSRAGERASNASRNSNAIPAAVSQIISLHWLEPDQKSDPRINLTTEGRNSKPVDLVIEQTDRSRWISHGTAEDIKERKHLENVEAKLSERQSDVLAELRDAWDDKEELTAPALMDRMTGEFDNVRKARATLQQLYEKKLADKRTDVDPEHGGTVIRYRPLVTTSRAHAGVCMNPPQPPQPPQVALGIQHFDSPPHSPLLSAQEPEEAEEAVCRPPRARPVCIEEPTPTLNGHTETFWQIVKDNPNDLPFQIANKFGGETKRVIDPQKVKALIAQGPPPDPFAANEIF